MGQDGSIELEIGQISPVVVESQYPQESGCPMGIWKGLIGRYTSRVQEGSVEFERQGLSPVVVELQRP